MRFLIVLLRRLLVPDRTSGRLAIVASLVLFVIGAALALNFLAATFNAPTAGGLIVALTGVAAACILPHGFIPLRVSAGAILAVLHLFWLYQATVLAVMLHWSVPAWLWIVDGVIAMVALAGLARSGHPFRLPVALPLGIIIAAMLSHWIQEDGVLRCDDYLRVRSSGVSVVVPSLPTLDQCVPGDSINLTRYPRRFWEYPEPGRFLVTTQRGRNQIDGDGAGWFSGSICRVDASSTEAPPCFGEGKAEAIVPSETRDALYVAVYGRQPHEGLLYAVPRTGALRPLATAHLAATTGEMYVDEARDVIGLFADEGDAVYQVRPSDFTVLDPVPVPIAPDEVHYDGRAHQGIACFTAGPLRRIDGQTFVAVAFDGAPFSGRLMAPSAEYPSSWLSLSWGCAWDPTARRVYAGVANLGLVEEIDYDTGRVERRAFVGIGLRSMAFDARRRRIYATLFLQGEVVAIDADSLAVVDRWFTGRFARYLRESRDGRSLLVSSNVGVVRIPLPDVPGSLAAGPAG